MAWIKKGRIFSPEGHSQWMDNSVLTPTPLLLNDETIRVYAAFRDKQGRGRIGYLDLDARDPANVLAVSQTPCLDLGLPGCFDDNGMIMGDVVRCGDSVYMYYVGFQLVKNVKFLAYSGLAISRDGGTHFKRHQHTPIMDRTDNALYIRAIHTVLVEDGLFRVWYSVGNGWQNINGVDYPRYDIRYTESPDGVNFPDQEGISCLTVGPGEYRIGRPRVRRIGADYEMRFTYDTLTKEYTSGKAFSPDGLQWTRSAEEDIPRSSEGWDSKEVCYQCVLDTIHGTYIFYDGNGMGREGFGYARWEQ